MRKWEEIIPELDREIYRRTGFNERQAYGERPALLIIDVVRSFIGSRREHVLTSMKEFRSSCGESGWDAVMNIQTLLHASRSAGIPIVYTKGDARARQFCGDSVKGVKSKEDIEMIHSTDFPDEIKPLNSEFVYQKVKASAFFASPLATYLHSQKVDCLLIAGTSTSGCVRASTVDAFSHGYAVFLVEECIFDRSEFSHLVNLFEMDAKYANVIQLEEAIGYLASLKRKDGPSHEGRDEEAHL